MAIPGAIGPLSKWAIRIAKEAGPVIAGYLFEQLDWTHEVTEVEGTAWVRIQFIYKRSTPAGTSEDAALFTVDVMNITGGQIDSTWTQADLDAVTSCIGPFAGDLLPVQSPECQFDKARIYGMQYNPAVAGQPITEANVGQAFIPSGPPLVVADYTDLAGTGIGVTPYQVAMTVTERTQWPRHWGRAYIPGIAAGALDSYGRFTQAARDFAGNAFRDFAADLAAKDMFVIIPSQQVNKHYSFNLVSVDSFQVDDVPDVQRRRRPKQAAARSQYDAP